MQETWEPQIPSREDPLEEETAPHSSILAWKIPDRRAWQATVYGAAKSQTWLWLTTMSGYDLIRLFTQQILTEYLLWTKYYSRYWE